MATVVPLGNCPAGYECVGASNIAGMDCIVTSVWLVPGGDPVYCHAALATPDEVHDEAFWDRVFERVRHHVQSRMLGVQSIVNGVSTYKGMALSNNPPTTGAPHVDIQPSPSLSGIRNATGSFDLTPAGTGKA